VASGGGTGVQNPSISGSSGLENLYVADGVSINDPASGALACGREFTDSRQRLELVLRQEVQIKTAVSNRNMQGNRRHHQLVTKSENQVLRYVGLIYSKRACKHLSER